MALSTEHREALAAVLDEIIPPSADGRLPGAGELGLADGFAAQEALLPLLEGGLDALDAVARDRGAERFCALPREERRAALDALPAEAAGLVPALVAQTIVAYYQDLRVWEAIGLAPRAPFPQGYAVPETDLEVLDPVREREPFYRRP